MNKRSKTKSSPIGTAVSFYPEPPNATWHWEESFKIGLQLREADAIQIRQLIDDTLFVGFEAAVEECRREGRSIDLRLITLPYQEQRDGSTIFRFTRRTDWGLESERPDLVEQENIRLAALHGRKIRVRFYAIPTYVERAGFGVVLRPISRGVNGLVEVCDWSVDA